MAVTKELSRFVRDALSVGKTREEITTVLTAAGWSAPEVTDALKAWADTPFAPPVPRPQSTVSARDFFIYALMFSVMIAGAFNLIQLFHIFIDLWFEERTYRSYGSLRWTMSVLIVMVPIYLWLVIRERRALANDPALFRSAIRKWLTYLTLLIAAVVLLGDVVVIIYTFLSGDLTLEFILKALVVGVIAGLIFGYHLADIRKGERA